MGITPDIIVAALRRAHRAQRYLPQDRRLFCNVKPDCVIENLTLPILYEAPLYLEEQGPVLRGLPGAAACLCRSRTCGSGRRMVERHQKPQQVA